MKFKLLLTLYSLFIALVAIATPAPNHDCPNCRIDRTDTRVKGIVAKPTAKKIAFRFVNHITKEEYFREVTLDVNGRFDCTFKLAEPTVMGIIYGEDSFDAFIEPGDQAQLQFSGNDFRKSFVFSGGGAARNTFFKKMQEQFVDLDDNQMTYEILERSSDSFKRFMNEARERKWSFINAYNREEQSKFSEHFRQYILANVNYWWAYNLLRYNNEHNFGSDGTVKQETIPATYFDFLDKIQPNNDFALTNQYYFFFIDQYLRLLSEFPEILTKKYKGDQFLRVKVPYLEILAAPNDTVSLETVQQGVWVKSMDTRSKFTSQIEINGKVQRQYWYKVTTSSNKVGWALGGCIDTVATEFSQIAPTFSAMDCARWALTNKTLSCVVARDLYSKIQVQTRLGKKAVLADEVKSFLAANPFEMYDRVVKSTYDENPAIAYHLIEKFESLETQSAALANISKTPQGSQASTIAAITSKRLVIDNIVEATNFVEIEEPLQGNNSKITEIIGKVEAFLPAEMSVEIASGLFRGQKETYPITVKNGLNFQIPVSLKEVPVMGEWQVSGERIPFYMQPNEPMNVVFNGSSALNTLRYTGAGSEANNYLVQFAKNTKRFDTELTAMLKTATVATVQNYLADAHKQLTRAFEKCEGYDKLPNQFKQLARADVDFWYAHQLMNYPEIMKNEAVDGAEIALPSNYYNFLNEIDTKIEGNGVLLSQYYIYFVHEYLDFLGKIRANAQRSKIELAAQYLSNETYMYLRADKLAMLCRRGNALAAGKDIKEYIKQCHNEAFNDGLRAAYSESRTLVKGNNAPDFTAYNAEGKAVKLSDFKGKIVYLDLWGTWCSPCRDQMPNSQKLIEQFAANDDVVFLYVALHETRKEGWASYIQNNQLKGVHLMVGARQDAGLMTHPDKAFRVKDYPANFVIDKQGKIAFANNRNTTSVQIGALIQDLRTATN
jgi:peroxiredoxin